MTAVVALDYEQSSIIEEAAAACGGSVRYGEFQKGGVRPVYCYEVGATVSFGALQVNDSNQDLSSANPKCVVSPGAQGPIEIDFPG